MSKLHESHLCMTCIPGMIVTVGPSMSTPPKLSLRARGASFSHALRGLWFLMQSQHNAWLHAVATIAVCIAAAWFRITRVEWCLIVLSMMTVWTAEAFNTALECLTDLSSPEFHPLAGKAKDVAAGGVLLAAVGAAIVGAVIFVPHVWTVVVNSP